MRDASIAIQARRDVQGEYRFSGRIDGLNRRHEIGANGALQSCAEQGVDDELAFFQQLCRKGQDARPAAHAVVIGKQRIALELGGWRSRQGCHGQARGLREAGENVAVPTVIAAATDDDDPVGGGPARAQVTQRRLAGSLHECVARYAYLVDGVGVEGADLCRGIQSGGKGHAVIILTSGSRQ